MRLKSKSSTSKKRHKSKGMKNTFINHNSVVLSGKGDPDFEGDADSNFEGDVDDNDSDDDIDFFKEKRYEKTKAKKLDNVQKQTTREGDSGDPVHRGHQSSLVQI